MLFEPPMLLTNKKKKSYLVKLLKILQLTKHEISLPILAPVTTAFGVHKVLVGLMLIMSRGTPKINEAVCATFVFNP